MIRSNSECELPKTPSASRANLADVLKSPNSKPRYADRFVPSRAGKSWHLTFDETLPPDEDCDTPVTPTATTMSLEADVVKTPKKKETAYTTLLKNEVLGYDYESPEVMTTPKRRATRRLFHFDSAERPLHNLNSRSPYSSSPMSASSQKFMKTPVRHRRRISKHPYKVLDAPELADDYYLNLVDWSAKDIISVGLGTTIYSWSAATASVSTIANLGDENDVPTSVKWNEKGTMLAVGSQSGLVRIWDIQEEKVVLHRASHIHQHRIGALEWDGDILYTGSRDKSIQLVDLRSHQASEQTFYGHTQEVCGLRWSSFNSCLASGGNDNTIFLWNVKAGKRQHVFKEHLAAVKALAWSPHDKHILASGGGSSDRCLKFWNAITGSCVASVNTNSQVCNVAWSKHGKELVTTHGYANNHIGIWKYPSLKPIVSLKGHTQRVLYMTMSPDGNNICTGAADETLRFWQVFEKNNSNVKKSPLDLFDGIR